MQGAIAEGCARTTICTPLYIDLSPKGEKELILRGSGLSKCHSALSPFTRSKQSPSAAPARLAVAWAAAFDTRHSRPSPSPRTPWHQ